MGMMVIRMVIVYIDHDSIDCLVEGEEPAQDRQGEEEKQGEGDWQGA